MLRIEHLTKTYGEKKAVDDLSLHIAPGEIYGFIGHNGAGKTTTLKSIAGILQFDAGDIRIGGTSIREDPLACKRMMAYIPDNPDLYEFMTGIKYLNFIADIFGVSTDDRQARIRDYAARFELTDDLAQPIAAWAALSGSNRIRRCHFWWRSETSEDLRKRRTLQDSSALSPARIPAAGAETALPSRKRATAICGGFW